MMNRHSPAKRSKRYRAKRRRRTRLDKRLKAYSTTVAAVAAVGAAQSAHAAINYTDIPDTPVGFQTVLQVDLNNDGQFDIGLSHTGYAYFVKGGFGTTQYSVQSQQFSLAAYGVEPGNQVLNTSFLSYARKLAASDMIGTANQIGGGGQSVFQTFGTMAYYTLFRSTYGGAPGSFPTVGPVAYGPWATGPATGFLGVQFVDTQSQARFGWLRLRMDDQAVQMQATLLDYAFETIPGQPIHAGAIPEPSSLAMLALGAAGVTAMKRRRR